MNSAFFWFRQDLRLEDNTGLFQALKQHESVTPVFIFDHNILKKLAPDDARVTFIHQQIIRLKSELKILGSDLVVEYGNPLEIWPKLLSHIVSPQLYVNKDYDPYSQQRDLAVQSIVESQNGTMHAFKDHVIFEENEVTKLNGDPYTVFTPYSRQWRSKLDESPLQAFNTQPYFTNFLQTKITSCVPSLFDLGFTNSKLSFPPTTTAIETLKSYHLKRDIPSLSQGTSHLGIHFRFGTISLRHWAHQGIIHNSTFLNELCWRDFYHQILWHFPRIINQCFKPKYDNIQWINDMNLFQKWCDGQTGYPLVDAGIRELNSTGYMHNRVRMVTASFLCKHLLINWQLGAQYFSEKLLDYDLAANNGGWQWSAGTGCDAAPYFRIFNPESQQKKFDPNFKYIKKWVPEYGTNTYPSPIVDHKLARNRALETYKSGLNKT